MKEQMRKDTVPYSAMIVDMDKKAGPCRTLALKARGLSDSSFYSDGQTEMIARRYTAISLRRVHCNVIDELIICVKPGMKDGFCLPEEINKHAFEAKVYFLISAVLIIVGIAMQFA